MGKIHALAASTLGLNSINTVGEGRTGYKGSQKTGPSIHVASPFLPRN